MNKRIFGRKLGRGRSAREALFASLIGSMILKGKIETSRAKAKAIQGQLEKAVSLAKKGTLAGRRRVLSDLDNTKDAVGVLFDQVVKSFKSRNSGFTRIINIPSRLGDNAPMVRLEWTEQITERQSKSKHEDVSTKKKGN